MAEAASICPPFDGFSSVPRACRGAQGGQAKVTQDRSNASDRTRRRVGAGVAQDRRGPSRAACRDARGAGCGGAPRDEPMVTNVRHEALLRQAHEAIRRAMANLDEAGESASEELVLADLADARGALEEVTGKRTTEDVLRRIFEKFCIGK